MNHDPIADLLRPLRDRTWHDPRHQQALRDRLTSAGLAPRRGSWARRAAVSVLLIAVFAAAVGGAPYVLRWFSLEVVDVQRDATGDIERIQLKTDDATLELRPLRRDREFDPPVVVVVPKKGGGELRVQVLRDVELDLLPKWVPVDEGGSSEPRTGQRFAVREVPCPWQITHEAGRLVLEGAGARRIELPRIPTPTGSLPRYGDDRGLVEVLDR